MDTAKVQKQEKVQGHYAAEDSNEYGVLYFKAGDYPDVIEGKYLVDEAGSIQYLVDPGINGRLEAHDDGTRVQKYNNPKARLMSFIVDGILTQKLPWALVLLGVAIALVLELSGVPSLPFAVGVYLPLSASTPIFCGGAARWLADRWSRRSATEAEMSSGVLLSSGYIAGGSIAAILIAMLAVKPEWAKVLDIGKSWLGALAESNGFTLVPFGLMFVLLLLVGADKVLRSRA